VLTSRTRFENPFETGDGTAEPAARVIRVCRKPSGTRRKPRRTRRKPRRTRRKPCGMRGGPRERRRRAYQRHRRASLARSWPKSAYPAINELIGPGIQVSGVSRRPAVALRAAPVLVSGSAPTRFSRDDHPLLWSYPLPWSHPWLECPRRRQPHPRPLLRQKTCPQCCSKRYRLNEGREAWHRPLRCMPE